jgi:hydroxymethylpyrimidine/phosphomethylpyrimidine kinase
LIESDGARAIREELVPIATLVTPNADEAFALTGERVTDEASMRRAAEKLVSLGAQAALIKGGHAAVESNSTIIDVLYDGEFTTFTHSRIDTRHTHGTGCTLSAAITAHLAMGVPLRDAVLTAIDYVQAALVSAPGLGSGHGPLNHFAAESSATKARTTD